MPGFDKTGPVGAGPMTGGARGSCNPAGAAYPPRFFRDAGFGKGMGWGQGSGFGRGRVVRGCGDRNFGLLPPTYSRSSPAPATELDMLKARANSFRDALDDIQQRIAELEKSS